VPRMAKRHGIHPNQNLWLEEEKNSRSRQRGEHFALGASALGDGGGGTRGETAKAYTKMAS